jgi:hypothetical protein
MKGDFSRQLFDPKKHYNRVLMQQGRVQLDADWNEQADISLYQSETKMLDLTGGCGGPLHNAAFGIKSVAGNVDFLLSTGRYYVDGILCENETERSVFDQPDLPLAQADFVNAHKNQLGLYVAYLDVWQRHLTAIDDPHIREVALGGPDTTTRAKTVWQVKLVFVGDPTKFTNPNCLTTFTDFDTETAPSTGALQALQSAPKPTGDNLCIVPPGAGYQGLENQLYRVEIHKAGALAAATFKWSRENGSVVTTIEKINAKEITVRDIGPDGVLGFARDQWVEIIDDALELNGLPGELRQIDDVDPARRVIKLKAAATKLVNNSDGVDPARHPKLRRWDYTGKAATDKLAADNALQLAGGPLDLENGVQVQFASGTYRTGDYWLIPARTASADAQSGNIEWPLDASTNQPLALAPFGIKHHYCRIALLKYDGKQFDLVQDCRPLFPPVTELRQLFYVSGDGQEVMPDVTNQTALVDLPMPIMVGVSNGRWPVKRAKVRFQVDIGAVHSGLGNPLPQTDPKILDVLTDDVKGLAGCRWQLVSDRSKTDQILQATLLDANDDPVHVPILFHANLSLASEVAYVPGKCDDLAGAKTVQEALDTLCLRKPTGGGCSVTVGEKGEFKTLREAVQKLLEQKQFDICICMLPGDHNVQHIKISDPKLRLKIEGCGSGTRLRWGSKTDNLKETTFTIPFVTLRDLDVNVESGNLNFIGCDEVAIESCVISQKKTMTDDEIRVLTNTLSEQKQPLSLLFLTTYKNIRIENCRISQVISRPSLQTFEIFPEMHPPLAELFLKTTPSDFQDQRIPTGINQAGATARGVLAARITEMVKAANAETSKKFKAMTDAIVGSATPGGTPPATGTLSPKELEPLRGVSIAGERQTPGIAISILDGLGRATIHNNVIEGVLCLYGLVPTPWKDLTDSTLPGLFKQGGVTFADDGDNLSVRNNRLTRVAIGREMMKTIEGFTNPVPPQPQPQRNTVDKVFRSAFFGENDIRSPINQFMARHLSLSSEVLTKLPLNFLPQPPVIYSHLAIARSSIYVGNYGIEGATKLMNLSKADESAQSANVNIVIA